jgi:hypothetical protein
MLCILIYYINETVQMHTECAADYSLEATTNAINISVLNTAYREG